MNVPLIGTALGRPMALQAAVVLAASAFMIGVLSFVTLTMARLSDQEDANSDAAQLAVELSRDMQAGTDWFRYEGAAMVRPEGPEAERPQVPADLIVGAADALDAMAIRATELHRIAGTAETLQILGLIEDGHTATLRYFQTLSAKDAEDLRLIIEAASAVVDQEAETRSALAVEQRAQVEALWNATWIALVAATLVAASTVLATTLALHRRQRRALEWALAERAHAAATGAAIQRRNEQFTALYHIVTEVSDSLSIDHVLETTIAQVRRIFPADAVAIRLLRDDHLDLVASSGSEGVVPSPIAVPLGKGILGACAKRGRILRIDEHAEGRMCEEELIPGVESGLVLPLVVGARVVGTIACWSTLPHHFSADDEHLLEMMAPQVARAVATAETVEAAETRARTDGLTSLPNRGQLERDLDDRYRALASDSQLAVAMVDIDHFKPFNDTFGHAAGDTALRTVARTLAAAVRGDDRVYRYGGEEFLVIFAGVDGETAVRLAERIREKVEHASITGPGGQVLASLSISIGVATHPGDGDTIGGVIEAADRALYLSKRGGRNRVTLAAESGPVSLAA